MNAHPHDLLTPAEAAVVAGVSVRDVHRVFDEQIIPERFLRLEGGRWLESEGCVFGSFYFHMASRLTADERSRVIWTLAIPKPAHQRSHHFVYKDDVLTVNFKRFRRETAARFEALRRAKEAVVEDPEILGGAPVLKGTRILVHDIAASLRAGDSVERLKAAYSGLDETAIELAKMYADAHPLRGRPRTIGDLHPELELISERKVARRHRG